MQSPIARRWVLVLLAIYLVVAAASPATRALVSWHYDLGFDSTSGETRFLGQARADGLHAMEPGSLGPLQLTTMGMQEARAPESAAIALDPWEDQWILVVGRQSGTWVYSARIEQALGASWERLVAVGWPRRDLGPD